MSKIWHSLPDDKILALSKSKAFADDKLNVTQKIKFFCPRIEKKFQNVFFFPKKYQTVAVSW